VQYVEQGPLQQQLGSIDQMRFYSLHKQATSGDAQDSMQSSLVDKVWEGWKALKGTTTDDAKRQYVELLYQYAPSWEPDPVSKGVTPGVQGVGTDVGAGLEEQVDDQSSSSSSSSSSDDDSGNRRRRVKHQAPVIPMSQNQNIQPQVQSQQVQPQQVQSQHLQNQAKQLQDQLLQAQKYQNENLQKQQHQTAQQLQAQQQGPPPSTAQVPI